MPYSSVRTPCVAHAMELESYAHSFDSFMPEYYEQYN